MSKLIIFDTSVLVEHIRSNRHLDELSNVDGLIRNSSVVLAELLRGAVTRVDVATIQFLKKNFPIFTPTQKDWLESGEILGKIRLDKGLEPKKLRDLNFDVLIALTARTHGAKLVTSNRADFELIRGYREFGLEIW